jgi:thiol:disulfide interchange protein
VEVGAGLALVFGCLALSPAQAATPAPKLQVRTLEQLRTPLPLPYDDRLAPADVDAQIDAAFARARATGKRVIVDLGGNWCSWCRILAAVMDLPEARPFIDSHFEVVSVATSVADASGGKRLNPQVLRRFNVRQGVGVPWLIVAEPDGAIVVSSSTVTDDSHHTPQAMMNWLAKQAKDLPIASTSAIQGGGY